MQPNKPGFAPTLEQSFEWLGQEYSDGLVGACAVDLVVLVGNGRVHRAPTWQEVPAQGSAEAKRWGVHCNVSSESWHSQPVEIDGHASWVRAGRPAPVVGYPFPGRDGIPSAPPATPPTSDLSGLAAVAAALARVKAALPIGVGTTGESALWSQIGVNQSLGIRGTALALAEDSRYGNKTAHGVRQVQAKFGLPQTGTVDAATFAAMFDPPKMGVPEQPVPADDDKQATWTTQPGETWWWIATIT